MYRTLKKEQYYINGFVFPSNCISCKSYNSPSQGNPIANGYPSLYIERKDYPGEYTLKKCGVYKQMKFME